MRRFVAIVVIAIALLVGAMAVVASRLPTPSAGESRVTLAVNADSAAAHLAGMLRFPTISRQDGALDSAAFRAQQAYLEKTYPLVHAKLTREIVGGFSLLYSWTGSDTTKAPVVLMGHMDVVPVIPGTEAKWTHPAFGGVIDQTYIWGRGALDDKATVIAVLEAVEQALRDGVTPPRTVYLAFGHDEESGGFGAKAIADLYRSRKIRPPALVLDEGGFYGDNVIPGVTSPVALVGVAEKGFLSLELSVQGEGGHSSTPPAVTHIGRLSRAVAAVEAHPFPGALDGASRSMFEALAPAMHGGTRFALANLWITAPLVTKMLLASPKSAAMLRTTTAPTIFQAGAKDNVLPPEARAVINFRIRPGETMASVQHQVETIINDTAVHVKPGGFMTEPSPVSDAKSAAFATVAKTIRQTLGRSTPIVAPYLVPGGTDARHWSALAPNVFRFNPFEFEADATSRFHGTDERTTVKGFADGVRYYEQLLKNLGEF